MAVIQGRTKAQIRQAIGHQLPGNNPGAVFIGTATVDPTAGADTSSMVDTKLRGSANNHSGKWLVLNEMADGDANSGHIARVDSNTVDLPATGDVDLTYVPASTDAIAVADSYELWDEEYNPANINDAMNAAIDHATGRIYDPVVDTSLFCDGSQSRYSLPSDVYMIQKVMRRIRARSTSVLLGSAAMDETVDADFTVTVDTNISKRKGSNKIVIAGTASNGDIATDSISSKNMSRYTHLELWLRVSADVAASDLAILLDDTASCASPVETLAVPAITAAARWTRVRIALANPHLDTAIISVGIEYNANVKANNIWWSDIIAIDADSEEYEEMNQSTWKIDPEARELILKAPGSFGYHQIKIVGGDRPARLSGETTVCEVPEEFVIAYAKALLLMGKTDANGKEYSGPLFDFALSLMKNFPPLQGVRKAA